LRNRKHVVRLAGRLAIELNADGAALRGLFETELPEMLRTLNARKTSQTRQEQSRPQAKQHPEEGVGTRHEMGSSHDRERPDASAAKTKAEAKGEETWPDVIAVGEAVEQVQDANSKTELDKTPKAKRERNVAPDARKPEQNAARNQTHESPPADKAGNGPRRDKSGQQKPAPGEEERERSRKAPGSGLSSDHKLKSNLEQEISRVASDLAAVQTESSVNAGSTTLPPKETPQTNETSAKKKQSPASALTQEQSRPTAPATIKQEQSATPKRRVRSVIHTRGNLQDTLAEIRHRHGIEQHEQAGASQDRGGQAASQEVASEGLREGKPQPQPNTSATATERAKEHPEESPKGWKGTVERSETGLPTVVRVRQSRLAVPKTTDVTWPRNLHDCKTAVRWLRQNAERLQLDPERIGAIGGSAGGHLSTMLALTDAKDGLDPQGPYGKLSCRVQAAVDLYGPADLLNWQDLSMLGKKRSEAPEAYTKASPATYAGTNNAPLLIIQGTADAIVSVQQSELLASALEKAGASYQLVIVPDAVHGFHLEPIQQDLRPLVFGFFDQYLKAKP
jgi:dienelactone hydrolase